MRILECSSMGDRRFSAKYARVLFCGVERTIEEHYQRCKISDDGITKCRKGQKVKFIDFDNKFTLGPEYLTPFYNYLWVKYLDTNPGLIDILKEYDDYNDRFRGRAINCQADVIRTYIKEGRDALVNKEKYQMLTYLFEVKLGEKY